MSHPDFLENEDSPERGVKRKPPILRQKISTNLTSIPILLCCFTSGLIDASVFNAWGVFASMQTGNTVILALGASYQPTNHPHLWLEALIAILFFFIGSFVTGHVNIVLNPLHRASLILSFAVQTFLIIIAASLVQGRIVPGLHPNSTEAFIQLVPLAMLSFQAAQQSVAARQLGLREIPTTVLTSVYCDLGNDSQLFAPFKNNWTRNRRFCAVVMLLVGAIAGGWLSRTSEGMTVGLWVSAGIKACITVAWLLWKDEFEKS